MRKKVQTKSTMELAWVNSSIGGIEIENELSYF